MHTQIWQELGAETGDGNVTIETAKKYAEKCVRASLKKAAKSAKYQVLGTEPDVVSAISHHYGEYITTDTKSIDNEDNIVLL